MNHIEHEAQLKMSKGGRKLRLKVAYLLSLLNLRQRRTLRKRQHRGVG